MGVLDGRAPWGGAGTCSLTPWVSLRALLLNHDFQRALTPVPVMLQNEQQAYCRQRVQHHRPPSGAGTPVSAMALFSKRARGLHRPMELGNGRVGLNPEGRPQGLCSPPGLGSGEPVIWVSVSRLPYALVCDLGVMPHPPTSGAPSTAIPTLPGSS